MSVWGPLHLAVLNTHDADLVSLMLRLGANHTVVDDSGYTARDLAESWFSFLSLQSSANRLIRTFIAHDRWLQMQSKFMVVDFFRIGDIIVCKSRPLPEYSSDIYIVAGLKNQNNFLQNTKNSILL